ncbi:MAG: bifunctional (p)ppGpp synthetase/guanosine-3',5'-bis(diphosphate) 3'-pyrophosphohydrolase [Clostridia bacterium]|jgi:myo-inositol-1(or 4)-monophosphatase|nr:bifunctional (p)ppGpp synthetase/guanosine-3',5'-bis(diphosphate) 3'-pyrophosphohydrolase [Clostridia bacterium]
MQYSVLEQAIRFAVDAHAGQKRKDGSPFILHPLEDAAIVSTLTDDLEVIAAAVLHDTVEDTKTTLNDIMQTFGPRVHALVKGETENKRPALPPWETWKIRKEESLADLASADDPAIRILWLGDKLANMRALYRAHIAKGQAAFDRFNIHDPLAHKWYYGEILRLLEPLAATAAYKEYSTLYHAIFDEYKGE